MSNGEEPVGFEGQMVVEDGQRVKIFLVEAVANIFFIYCDLISNALYYQGVYLYYQGVYLYYQGVYLYCPSVYLYNRVRNTCVKLFQVTLLHMYLSVE